MYGCEIFISNFNGTLSKCVHFDKVPLKKLSRGGLFMAKRSDWDGSREPENYEEWLDASDSEDTPTNRAWYDCPDEERYDFIKNHKSWWDKN